MYNLMIIERNPKELDKIVNSICDKFQNIRVCHISYDDKKVLNILEKNIIDFILLDCKTNEINDLKFVNYIQNKKLEQYKKSIIVKLDKTINLNDFNENRYIFSYTSDINTMYKDIRKLVFEQKENHKFKRIKNKIKEQLTYLRYNYSHSGTRYIEETILEIYKDRYNFDGNLSKNIYPIIAKKHNKTVDTIYGNIKQATNYMLLECNKDRIMNYLGYGDYVKPKIQDIIFAILNKME